MENKKVKIYKLGGVKRPSNNFKQRLLLKMNNAPFLNKYHNNNIKRWKTTSIFLVMTVTICLLNIMLSNILGKQSYIFSLDCSPLILISAISVFYLFKSFTFQKKWINYISSSVLAVYLLDGIRIAISEHITHLEQYSSNPYLIICLCATISITFICSITIDKLRIAILGPAETKLIQIIQTQCKKVNYFINNHFNKL